MENDTDIMTELAAIREDLSSVKAMLIEFLEFKTEIEEAMANFQAPNLMKMLGGMFGGSASNGGNTGTGLPRLPGR